MKEFWGIHTTGFMDMRGAIGPFNSLDDARNKALEKLPTFERNGLRDHACQIGDWFIVHRDSPDDGTAMTMVDGPYRTEEEAERERLRNISNEQSFTIDCNEHKGFVAQVIELLPFDRALVVHSK